MQPAQEEYDFVVVGSGGGSMCAALYMRTLGKSVLVLEKADKVGGTTATAGGVMWIPNNRFMKQAGIEDSYEKAMTYLDAVVGDQPDAPGATRERRSAYVTEGTRMVDFLVGQGIKLRRGTYWPDYYDERPGSSVPGRTVIAELFDVNTLGPWKDKLRTGFLQVPVAVDDAFDLPTFKYSWKGKRTLARMLLRGAWAKVRGRQWVTAGAALQGRMLQAALRAGVEFRLESPVKEILVENDRVAGVVVSGSGGDTRIAARLGVLLNAGGFARNQRMRDQYIPGTSAEWTNASLGDTGEVIEEAQRIGAAIAQMDARVGNQMAFPPNHEGDFKPMIQMELAKPHAMLVDQTGQRYMNEGGSYSAFCKGQLARNAVAPSVPSWMIVDSAFIKRYMLASSLPGVAKPAAWFAEGFLKKADSLAELARQCEIDPAALQASVERFNGFARNGRDEDFGRGDRKYDQFLGDAYAPNATLGTIEQGPFYALKIYPGDVGTYGGVLTDSHARVLREDGSVIEGLYATGVTTASVMGQSYPGAGASIGPSFTWGFVAAKHAARGSNVQPQMSAAA